MIPWRFARVRIGFFFNHDQAHQVAHALPIALSLMKHAPDVEVVIATSGDRLADEVRRLAARLGAIVPVVELGLSRPLSRFAARRLDRLVPAVKLCVYRDNLDFFRGLDTLVVAEKTSLILKTRYRLDHLRIVHTRHGAGDRAIGFNRESALFDQVLVSGPKIRDRLIAEAGVAPERLAMIGYPKFDLAPERGPPLPFANPRKPVVLYNPHPAPHLSSWYRHGRAVLEHFLRDDRFNLIFAPHVMLFHRRFVLTIDKLRLDRPGPLEPRWFNAPNIYVDLGSRASTDMSYTQAADIYLGDVSSQVYEFLRTPRPCVFLNSHGAPYEGDVNHLHWRAGEVIGCPGGLGPALARADGSHRHYLAAQRTLFEHSFDLTDMPSSDRAAQAILAGTARTQPVRLVARRRRRAIAA